jgi:hypothetical protein
MSTQNPALFSAAIGDLLLLLISLLHVLVVCNRVNLVIRIPSGSDRIGLASEAALHVTAFH